MHTLDAEHGLRLPEPRDVEALYRFKNDPEVTASLVGFSRGYSRADIAAWIEAHRAARDEVLWAVVATKTDACLGHLGLYRIDHRCGSAELGVLLGDRATWGAGLGTRCVRFAIDYGFEQLALRRLHAEALATNERTLRMFARLGFVEEGRRRQAQLRAGRYVDVVEVGLLRDEHCAARAAREAHGA